LRARVTKFKVPLAHDGIVLGRLAPLGLEPFRRAIALLTTTAFEHIDVADEIIGDILVRGSLLRWIGRDELVEFVLRNVKPMMTGEEILHLDLDVEVDLDHAHA
jgi:hypothetical protein